LMERKPRPLEQPVLSRSQWARIVFLGIVMAAGTLILERAYTPAGAVIAVTMGATVFSLYNILVGVSCRSETGSAFNRDLLADRRQVQLYGLALLLTILGTELGFLQHLLGTASLTGQQWLVCIVVALTVLVVDEVIKLFMRRSRGRAQTEEPTPAPVLAQTAA